MSNISQWSETAGDNSNAPPDGWPEGMARSAVNDCGRENMAAIKRNWVESKGELVSGGSANAYTVTTNSSHQALADIGVLRFRADRVNTGAPTLNVDGLGAKPIRRYNGADLAAGDIYANRIVCVVYNSDRNEFEAQNLGEFPSGTRMLFNQTVAPPGWTKDTTRNDRALRLVNGSVGGGGTTAFSSVFTSRTILKANLPSYNLSHNLSGSGSTSGGISPSPVLRPGGTISSSGGGPAFPFPVSQAAGYSDDFSVSISGNISLGGSGTAMDFDVQYVDVILAVKD